MECDFHHEPVLLEQTIAALVTDPSATYVDGTIGGGGHSRAILDALNAEGRLIGLDRDPKAIAVCKARFSNQSDRVSLIQGVFGNMQSLLSHIHVDSVHGILLDLGVSSYQIDTPGRGFSYLSDGPLDMRMNPETGRTARDVVMRYSESDLADIFFQYGEERYSRQIARRIVEARRNKSIETTDDFTAIIRAFVPERFVVKTLSRISQAIRIEVNDELEQLRQALFASLPLLKGSGRIVVLTYHSLEDRIVKRFLRGEEPVAQKSEPVKRVGQNPFRVLAKRVVKPDPEEIRRNPRARSAKLRAAEKVV